MRRHSLWIALGCLGACAHQDPVTDYLAWQRKLVDTDPAQWTEMYASLTTRKQSASDRGDRIRLALLLSTHDRPATDLQRARKLLEMELADPGTLTPATRDLLLVRLEELNWRLSDSTRRLAVRQRIRELEQDRNELKREGEVLTEELRDVRSKLRALTQIERTLEQEHNNRGKQP